MSKPTEYFNLWNCDFNTNFVSLKGSRIILETSSHIYLWGYFQELVNWTWFTLNLCHVILWYLISDGTKWRQIECTAKGYFKHLPEVALQWRTAHLRCQTKHKSTLSLSFFRNIVTAMSKVINTLIYKDYEKKMYENKKANVVILDHYDDDFNFLMDRILYIYMCIFIFHIWCCCIY